MDPTPDTASRVEIVELMARYCHAVDHGDGPGWAALFTPEGRFEVVGAFRLDGAEQLSTMPAVVAQKGGGKWRHQVTNLVVDPGDGVESARLRAYGIVTDWGNGGSLVSFTDYEIRLRRLDGAWRIETLEARMP